MIKGKDSCAFDLKIHTIGPNEQLVNENKENQLFKYIFMDICVRAHACKFKQ